MRKRTADFLAKNEADNKESLAISGTTSHHKHSRYYEDRSKMGEGIFNKYMENIWRSFSEDKRAAFAHLDSLYFRMYQYPNKRTQALEQIKTKDIFSKKGHWRLVIFCHFGQATPSKTTARCILLLDSAESCADLIAPDLRKFVFDIFKAEGRAESKNVVSRIPLLVPKVPQQKNDVDCGRFVLYFIKLFMENAPENFSTSKGYPYFMKLDWFSPESFAMFCDKLDEEIPKHKQEVEQVPKRCSQRITNTRASAKRSFRQDKVVIILDDLETSS